MLMGGDLLRRVLSRFIAQTDSKGDIVQVFSEIEGTVSRQQ